MELKHIKTMVSERKRRRGLKPVQTYHYKKHWVSSSNDYLNTLNNYGLLGNVLDRKLKIGGIIVED